jgi:glycerol-3-phosphate dehydrogenase (NAD(P)+)
MKISVLGAGAWGTALAVAAARMPQHIVTLWARDARQQRAMQGERNNPRYLPGLAFPEGLRVSQIQGSYLRAHLASQDLVVIATPMAGLRDMLTLVADLSVPVAWLCKGFEARSAQGGQGGQGLLGHEIQAQCAPSVSAGVLSGPSFAMEVALGQPTALVAASAHASVRGALVDAFHSLHLRVYASEDVFGVEVGGAVKNVMAIATGLCDGLQLGLNARAALITRGLAEMTRLGLALGAKAETFMGLSGLGDLVLTATGDLSRNRRIGLALAQGQSLDQAVQSLGHVAEGVYSARTVLQRAHALGVQMPITRCVVALLEGQLQATEVVAALMGREPAAEM